MMIRRIFPRVLYCVKKISPNFSYFQINKNFYSSFSYKLNSQVNVFRFSTYPKHEVLTMPALSPTMTQGKILKWLKNVGDKLEPGDLLCEIQTDKTTVGYQIQEKCYLAQLRKTNQPILVGNPVAVVVKKTDTVKDFQSYTFTQNISEKTQQPIKQIQKQKILQTTKTQLKQPQKQHKNRVVASPAARALAKFKGINIEQMKQGSGPNGIIIKQDVENFKQSPIKEQVKPAIKKVPQKIQFYDNPFEQIPLNNMRKIIAARLTQSKTTIPHYYINCSILMDEVINFRTQLNKNQKQNGVKISVNDIILKAMALALRDYPIVNSQWHENIIKRFKHADVSVAVATEGGLITPIVFKAQTLGLIDIAKRTKDIAKRAREGKLDPRQYTGGTSTISNLGMYGINSVSSVINLPQSTIVGVGKTQKKIIFNQQSQNTQKPYKVANMMQIIVSADHRVVDGAVAAQWVTRIKKYLQNPIHMLL